MDDTKISDATSTTPPLATDVLPLARSGDTTARKITVGNFIANIPDDMALAAGKKLTLTNVLDSITRFVTFATADPAAGNFNIVIDDTAVLNGNRDNVFMIGYNVQTNGVREATGATDIAAYLTIEHKWKYGANSSRMENYFAIVNAATNYRPYQINYEYELDTVKTYFNNNTVYFLSQDSNTQFASIDSSVLALYNNLHIRGVVNNVDMMRQLNFSGSQFISMIKLDASDHVILGDSTHMTIAAGGLGVGNSAAATTPGSVVKKMQVFDAAGVSLGYVPIYGAIT